MQLDEFSCNCGATTGDHEDDCRLQDCGAFTLGMVRWNAEECELEADPEFDVESLRPMQVRQRRHGEPYNTDTFRDWTVIDRIDGTIDYWQGYHSEEPGPWNFSALGVTWVWDYAHARWEAKKLGCYCATAPGVDEDGYEQCDRCQVIRKVGSTKWLQGNLDRDEPVCRCVPPATYTCTRCGVTRSSEADPWRFTPGSEVKLPPLAPPCDHRMVPVSLGIVTFYASRFHSRTEGELLPDWGVYLDRQWGEGDTIGTLIPWADFGLPRVSLNRVHRLCEQMVERAALETIEVGCMGGHGRTGTFLACCAVVAGYTASDAIDLVREEYCEKAIETERQEWYVHAMHAVHHNVPAPPMPEREWTAAPTTKGVSFQSSLLGQTPRCRDCHTSPLKTGDTRCDICGGPIV